MAKAKIVCKSVEVVCGHCGETIEEPRTRSVFWVLTELEDRTTLTCDSCGHENKLQIPSRVATTL